jgi:hypothetical protein
MEMPYMSKLPPLEECLTRLADRRRLHLEAAEAIVGNKHGLTVTDMLAMTVLNRSLAVIDGFASLVATNFVCAAALVRFQLDNALRFSAVFRVSDTDDFVKRVIEGERTSKIKDKDGKPMTDTYLVSRMEEQHPDVKKVYDDACGYVHLSEKHILHTFMLADDGSMRMEIGGDSAATDHDRRYAVATMDGITRLLLGLMKDYIRLQGSSERGRIGAMQG